MGSVKSLFQRKYYDAKAVDDISFSIKEGELVGFIGPNGAGKTTTLKCLSGLLYPTEGSISVLGYTPFKREHAFLKQISFVMGQKNQLWWDLPPIESFILNKEIYEVPNDQFKKTLADLSELLDIKDILNVQVKKLSLGQRMKCELIAALIHRPKVLFLDEPTIGLDVVMQKKLRDFIKRYNEKYKSTIILTSHYMRDVEQLCKRVIIIDKGNILYDGLLANIVRKYSKTKSLSFSLYQDVDRKEIEKLGEITAYDFPRITMVVSREKSNIVLSKLLEDFSAQDITIEEPQIEDVIRNVFITKAKNT